MKTKWITILSFVFSLCLIHTQGLADQTQGKGMPDDKTMAEMMKLGQPSEAHKNLEPLVGKWSYTVTMWMKPGDQPQTMKGKGENTLIMGNRFLQQQAHGEAQGDQPAFEGMGLTGYDNIRKEYTSTWVDSMTTGMMASAGKFDDKTKTFTEKGTFSCPMTKEKHRPFKAKLKVINNDEYTYEMYTKEPNGKEYKSMEIAYKREK